MDKVLKDLLDKIPETIKNKNSIKAYLDRLLRTIDSFKEDVKTLEEKILNTKQYQYLEMQKSFGINPHGLDTKTLNALKKKGFIKEDGLLVSDLMAKEQPAFVEDYIKHSRMSREQAFINMVINTPTARERAEQLAMNKAIRSFAYDLAKSMCNLEKARAKTHKSIAGAVMKALHNAFGDKKENATKVKHDIERVAEIDVGQGRYKDLYARNMMGNASFENRKVQKALAEGDMEGAVKHSRNEYYLNHNLDGSSGFP
jgi:gas vesicle protein